MICFDFIGSAQMCNGYMKIESVILPCDNLSPYSGASLGHMNWGLLLQWEIDSRNFWKISPLDSAMLNVFEIVRRTCILSSGQK